MKTCLVVFLALLLDITTVLAAPGSLEFSAPIFTASEADTITVGTTRYLTPPLSVTRTGGSTGALTVSYRVWASEVTDNAVQNTNYRFSESTSRWVAAGTLIWADGDTAPKTLPFNYTDSVPSTQYNWASRISRRAVEFAPRVTHQQRRVGHRPVRIADDSGPSVHGL